MKYTEEEKQAIKECESLIKKEIDDWKFTAKYVEDNYISKDKIREKIDDLQGYKGLVMYEKYNYDAIIRHLKELLGE